MYPQAIREILGHYNGTPSPHRGEGRGEGMSHSKSHIDRVNVAMDTGLRRYDDFYYILYAGLSPGFSLSSRSGVRQT